MNRNIIKQSAVLFSACLCMVASVSQAAGLNTFSNGSVADANDVNDNFTYLNNRIDNISLTPGPAGPIGLTGSVGTTGPAGPAGSVGATGPAGTTGLQGSPGATGATGSQGPAGANGVGAIVKSWVDYDNSAYSQKVFVVSNTNGSIDKEVQTFNRIDNGDGTGTIDETRQRTLLGIVQQHIIKRLTWNNNGDYSFVRSKKYDPANTGVLVSTVNFSPPAVKLNNGMGMGLRWGTASQITEVFANGDPDAVSYYLESHSLLDIEDITVLGVAYSACLKIETIRRGNRQKMNWHCPGNVGLVKSIEISNGFSSSTTRVKELDASQSTLAAP